MISREVLADQVGPERPAGLAMRPYNRWNPELDPCAQAYTPQVRFYTAPIKEPRREKEIR